MWIAPLVLYSESERISYRTSPENPIKAIAKMPAVISAMGTPFMALGTFSNSRRSRKPANNTKANVNPMATETAYTTASPRLYSFCTRRIATPKTAQLVVISGKKIPKA